jgi:DNA processing protein
MSENVERTRAFLRVWLTPGLGLAGARRLLDAVGDPRALDSMSLRNLVEIGIGADVARDLASRDSGERAAREWDRAISLGVRVVDLGHPDYPPLLGEIPDPPLILYIRGARWHPDKPHIAIVGSRRPTPYGVNCAGRIGQDLAERDVVVVSGLARGIDTAAHRGALASGSSIAVLGTGVDRVYPAENRGVAESLTQRGALVSEFPLGTLPLPQNFPRRNRILAGMSLATVVVEAAEKSGSLITARLALEANREVFAVPGPIHSPRSLGPHQLIQQGAYLVTGWQDIARELAPKVELIEREADQATGADTLSPCQAEILNCLSFSEDIPVDALLSKAAASTSEVYSAILDLELRGLVRRLAGDRYVRNEV